MLGLALAVVALPAMGGQGGAPRWKDPLLAPASSMSSAQAFVDSLHVGQRAQAAVNNPDPTALAAATHAHRELERNLDAQRVAAYRQLGIDPHSSGQLFILVSNSMPAQMLAGYGESAMWTGAQIVFRGIDPQHDIPWFVQHVMHKLLRGHGVSPSVVIDPRVFRAYGVTAVPTLVYSTVQPDALCRNTVTQTVAVGKKKPPVPYRSCGPADPAKYWKISGAVSVDWALRQFRDAHAPGVGALLHALQTSPWFKSGRKARVMTEKDYAKAAAPSDYAQILHLLGNKNPWADWRGFSQPPLPGLPRITVPKHAGR